MAQTVSAAGQRMQRRMENLFLHAQLELFGTNPMHLNGLRLDAETQKEHEKKQKQLRREEIRLRGRHNVENALAATTAALAFGVAPEAIGPALAGRWSLNRGPVEAFLAASRLPALCGLAARDMRLIDSGGYAYLHRDVPLSGVGLRLYRFQAE